MMKPFKRGFVVLAGIFLLTGWSHGTTNTGTTLSIQPG